MSNINEWMVDNHRMIHFFICSVLLYLLSQSKRINSKLTHLSQGLGEGDAMPQFPNRDLYKNEINKEKKKALKEANKYKNLHGREFRKKKRQISRKLSFCYWSRFCVVFIFAFVKRAKIFLRQKLKFLPSAKTGVYINGFACLFLTISFQWLDKTIRASGLDLYFETERELVGFENVRLFLSLASPIFIAGGMFLLLTFISNREVYFDFYGIGLLLFVAIYKGLVCGHVQCCYGIPYEWGVYNEELNAIAFPVQYFEAITALLGVIACILFMLFAKSWKPGRVVCIALAWFSASRFAAEFFRYTDEEMRPNSAPNEYGFSVVHWVCIAAFVFAVIMWFLLPVEKRLLDLVREKGKAFFAKFKNNVRENEKIKRLITQLQLS